MFDERRSGRKKVGHLAVKSQVVKIAEKSWMQFDTGLGVMGRFLCSGWTRSENDDLQWKTEL